MSDYDGDEMAALNRFAKRPSATWAGRRELETRPLARADRMSISTISKKERQLNLKITAELYEHVAALARNAGVSMPVLFERMVAAYGEKLR